MFLTDNASEAYRDRCEFWVTESVPKPFRRLRQRESNPLILTGHGLSVRVDKGCLLVRGRQHALSSGTAAVAIFPGWLGHSAHTRGY